MDTPTMSTALTSLGTVITQVMTIIEGNSTLFAMFVVPLLGKPLEYRDKCVGIRGAVSQQVYC